LIIEGKQKCFCCGKLFNWNVIIKGDLCETISDKMDMERGIPTFVGKNKIEIDVNCPSCHNVNRFSHKIK